MKDMDIRLLNADEIDCRIGTISEKGLSLLLYKNARADMRILDETFGCFGWQRTHQSINGNLYCTVQIWDSEKLQWISKQDVGTESYTEKEKGQASDSFKRACVGVGIGRELYSAPFIWIPAQKCHIQEKNGKYVCFDKFFVKDINYNSQREIASLNIRNQEGSVVYSLAGSEKQSMEKKVKGPNTAQITQMNKELERTGVALDTVLSRYQISNLNEMTQDIYSNAMNSLKKTKGKVA